MANSDPEASGFSDDELLAPGLAVLAMLGWIGVLLSLGAALLRARDVD